jgi:hypothetical protein
VGGALALGAGLWWSGCASNSGFEPIVACADTQSVQVHVTTGDAIRFTWAPGCGMSSIQVWADTGMSAAWVVYSGSHAAENPLPSGIVYGQLPPEGVAPGGAHPLAHGRTYHVTVYRWVGPPGGPGSIFQRGSAGFTP